jgi:cobalt/nickel transport system permease protein
MHIPDGFLDAKTIVAADVVAATGVATALWQTRKLPPRRVPLLGLSAAFVFAAQMLNFPVAGGTSGHLLGGVLVAALLGPSSGVLVVTSVLLVQCFLFADGGVLALGANVLNMAIIDSITGYYIYRAGCRLLPGPRGRIAAVAFAAWSGAVLASVVCSGELALSGTIPARVAFPAMVGVHALIGIGEGLITALVVLVISQSRPELLEPLSTQQQPTGGVRLREFITYGLIVSVALALFVSPFACPWPDGLDHVAAKFGFAAREVTTPLVKSPLSDYKVPGVGSVGIATALAGLIGTAVVFGLALALARILVRSSDEHLADAGKTA